MKYSKLNKLITSKTSSFALAGVLIVSTLNSATAIDAPGSLAQQPLQTSATAQPNIMFMIDTSGSMNNVVPDSPYNSSTDYTPAGCGSTITKTTTTATIYLYIVAAVPKIRYSSTNYDLTDRCFDETTSYSAKLNADTAADASNKTPSGYLQAKYTGNFLNWYFSSTDNTSTWTNQAMKPATGVNSRLNIAKSATSELISGLANMRIGLTTFNSGDGGYIEQNVKSLTVSHKSALVTSISNLTGSGSTPVAETLLDIGRYFVGHDGSTNPGQLATGSTSETNGQYDGNLIMHPTGTSITDDDDDIFSHTPTYKSGLSSESPIQYWCQQNFAILLTDGSPQSDQGLSTTTYTVAAVRDYDGDCVSASPACGSYDQKAAGVTGTNGGTYAYNSSGSDYMDDVAMLLNDIDLRPDIDDNNGDEVKNNIITYTIGFADDQVINDPLMYDTAANGGGQFKTASNADDLKTAFSAATNNILGQTSTSSSVTFNSSTLSSQSAVYQALYNTASWSGELNSFPIDGFTGDILISSCTDAIAQAGTLANCWQAAYQLDQQTDTDSEVAARFMITYSDDNTGVEFKYADGTNDYTSLTSTTDVPQGFIDDICADSNMPFACNASTTADSTKKAANSSYIEDMVNYLRGDKSEEGSSSTRNFRVRLHALGDIVNSSPVYVGAPQQNWPSTGLFPPSDPTPSLDKSYFTWKKSSVKDRAEIVYLASNDGILHGFQTKETVVSGSGLKDAGNEVFAFIPTGTFEPTANVGIHYLADSNYSHKFYNDLSPTIADVYMDYRSTGGAPTTSAPEWRTVLLGGQGGGGKNLYLLDITDPDNYISSKADELVLWEFSDATNLGYTYAKPTIAMMNDGRFAAVFGNGYNSASCTAQLFIVFLEGGLNGVWSLGTDYLVMDTGAGDTSGNCNGLSTPAVVDLNGDGTADRVYAGDLRGNMWAFDLCNLTSGACATSGWAIADSNPMMVADDGTNLQPITVKPIVSRDPASSGFDDLLIVFGTGQYLVDGDKATTAQQTMYGMRDYGALSNTKAVWNKDPRTNPNKFQVNAFDYDSTTGARTIDTPEKTMSAIDTGWLIDLGSPSPANDGERVVVNPKVRNNILFFNTLIPDDTKCSYGGSGWLMSVNLENGGTPPDVVFDLDGDGTIGNSDDFVSGAIPVGVSIGEIPAESTFLGDNQYTPGSDGTINKRKVNIGETRNEGRMSWKEIYEEQ